MTRTRWAAWGLALVGCAAPGGATTGTGSTTGSTGSTGSPTTSGTTTTIAATSTGEGTTTGPIASTGEGTSAGEGTSTGSSGGATSGSSGGPPATLRIEPAMAMVTVASGWSFPAQFTAILDDGQEMAVEATWTLDDAALGRVTRFGGTFQARNTKAGPGLVTAEYAGLTATAAVEVTIVDEFPVCPPKPALTEGEPAPGQFVKVVAPEYAGKAVYHGVYLPPGWQPGRRYPVIVESPCNKTGATTGKVEDAQVGYQVAGCREFVWVVVPYILNGANLDAGWGAVDETIAYWRVNVQRALAAYGGDPGAVFVAGFSRGAIGASFVGLNDDAIADQWLGFFMHSHADVVSPLTPDMGAGSAVRMGRVAGRASLLSWGSNDGGKVNSVKGVELLTSFGYPVTSLEVPGIGHTEAWLAADQASREAAQSWLFATLAQRTGTGAIYGRVVDGEGKGVAGARIEAGPLHATTTDAAGHYGLTGLLPGSRTVTCAHPMLSCADDKVVEVGLADLDDVDFVATP